MRQLLLATFPAGVYTKIMASLQKKTARGHTYWQLVQSRRVNGKPRPIVLAHLGKADDLLARLRQTTKPLAAAIRDSAAVAALWKIAQDLDLASLIDHHAGKRQQGYPVAS